MEISKLLLVLLFLVECCQCFTLLMLFPGVTHGWNNFDFADRLESVINESVPLQAQYRVLRMRRHENGEMDRIESLISMNRQLELYSLFIRDSPTVVRLLKEAQKVTLVGCSQGSLIARGLLWSNVLDPFVGKLDKLVTFGGPNNGQYGLPKFWKDLLNVTTDYCIVGHKPLQEPDDQLKGCVSFAMLDQFMNITAQMFSVAGYWHSPARENDTTNYLTMINNQLPRSGSTWHHGGRRHQPYLAKKLQSGFLMIEFGLEKTVQPPISAQFGYWNTDATLIIPYYLTKLYLQDLIGLRELDQRGKLRFYRIADKGHLDVSTDFIREHFFQLINW